CECVCLCVSASVCVCVCVSECVCMFVCVCESVCMQGCVYNLCVCVIRGLHWVTAFFWLMSQQTDICAGPWRWRVFNGTLAIVHVFCFLNVKDGPSRFRMARLSPIC